MIKIGTTEVQQNKGGLSIKFTPVFSGNEGTSATGSIIGTLIGERVVISIATNILTEVQAKAIEDCTNTRFFYITYQNPKTKATKTELFTKDGDRQYTYNHQKRGIYESTTLVFKSKELS